MDSLKNKIRNAATFKMLPLVKQGDYVPHVNKNLSLTEMHANIENFKSLICDNENYAESEFTWYNKKLPLLIKYLYWKGLCEIVSSEEIGQILALEAHIEGKEFKGLSQWWHDYADYGFDVYTTKQYESAMKMKLTKSQKLMRVNGLTLVSTRPGAKYSTRKHDANDPLDWGKKKQEFDHSCASCGEKDGHFGGKNNILVRLEKGHIDPRKGYSHSNIIPQCGSCNNHKGNVIYGPSPENPKHYIPIGLTN